MRLGHDFFFPLAFDFFWDFCDREAVGDADFFRFCERLDFSDATACFETLCRPEFD